jgi:RimJ/RimL family protein N-acetyltransferase
MVTGQYANIRAADPDDAPALHAFYTIDRACSALLDHRREPLLPTVDELRETLGHKDAVRGAFHVIEDKTGVIQGFCGLRGVNQETGFGEIVLMLYAETTYDTPLAGEAIAFLAKLGFERMRLFKLVTHGLDTESGLRACLLDHGFVSEGVQRDILYTQGAYRNLEAFSLFHDAWTRP